MTLSVPTGGSRDAQPGGIVALHVQEGVQQVGDGAEQVRQQVAEETTVEQTGHGAEQVAEQVAGSGDRLDQQVDPVSTRWSAAGRRRW